MWSLGCILYELHTGDPIFNGTSEQDQVLKLTEMLGIPPAHMLEKGRKTSGYFKQSPSRRWQRVQTTKDYTTPKGRKLEDCLGSKTGGPGGRRQGEQGHDADDYARFEDLLARLLDLDPVTRMTPSEALHHAFLRQKGPLPSAAAAAAPAASGSSRMEVDPAASSSSRSSSNAFPSRQVSGRASA